MSTATLRPVEELLWSWPTVCRMASTVWARSFAASIAKQAKRRHWTPSPKQHALMQRMVSELYQHKSNGEGDFDVIDAG
ncbi:hypothetical protein [Paracoccus sp. SCSIO 75233]|uniref:hypothetical protein n=1 Tax=Paracoccus sp. SCSIO 75233 TaxID=3017782 RepID=UPI0022F0FCF9|nr:hypothetical protein [Paracoccus sp. SCSIO 75233]WBU51890.1 hypothetical protein PAF12_08510 [Paracoccus sp. SCSIO 75233]